MANSNNTRRSPGSKLPGGIGCLAIVLLVALIATALGVALGKSPIPGNGQSGADRSESIILASPVEEVAAIDTPHPPNPIEPTKIPSATTAATVVSSATAPAKPSATTAELTATVTRSSTKTPTAMLEQMPAEVDAPDEEAISWPTSTPLPPPLPTPRDTFSWTLKVPILMYHYISEAPEDADKYRRDLSVAPDIFREQMTYLVENGFETIDLYDLSLAITDKAELPPKPIIITMDDGYRDNYENAFPILEELGLTATFFLVTEFIDQDNDIYMNWAMVEEMASAGHRFEPHSKTHPDLTIHDRDFIIWEVQGSRETISAHIGYMPRYLAYPGGRFNEEVQQIVAELDFWGAVTTLGGTWNGYNDRFEWTRSRIRDVTTLNEFAAMVE